MCNHWPGRCQTNAALLKSKYHDDNNDYDDDDLDDNHGDHSGKIMMEVRFVFLSQKIKSLSFDFWKQMWTKECANIIENNIKETAN